MQNFFNSIFRKHERGNVATVLFGSVAMVGVISAATMQMISGPIRTASQVNNKNLVEAQLITATRVIVLDSSSTDIDADGTIEPPAYGAAIGLTGGGAIPASIGAPKTDPWNTDYGYCAWDNGTDFTAAGNRLDGENTATAKAIALISAGPDRVFQTSCNAYPTANPVNKPAGSDDFVFDFTYAEAAAAGGSLWETGATTPQNEVVVKDSTGSETVVVNKETGIGDFFGLVTDIITAKTGNTLRLDGSSGIGINTDPYRPLVVRGDSVSVGEHRVIGVETSNGNESLSLGYDADGSIHSRAFLRTNNSRPLHLGTNGNTNSIVALDNGDVGINNSSPIVALDVAGSLKVGDGGETCSGGETSFPGAIRYNSVTDTIEFCKDNGGSADAWENLVNAPGYWTLTGSNIYYNSGNVGINTTNPTSSLEIGGTGTVIEMDDGAALITMHDGSGNFNIKSGVLANNTINSANAGGTHVRLDEAGYFHVYLDENTASGGTFAQSMSFTMNNDLFTFLNGTVEIDQNEANTAFEVRGGGGGSPLARFIRDIGSDGESVNIVAGGQDIAIELQANVAGPGTQWNIGIDDSDTDRFSIFSGTGAAGAADEFTIESNGNVGIGTIAPPNALSVEGTIGISEDGLNGNRLLLSTSGAGAFINQNDNSNLTLQTQGVSHVTIEDGTGNVGIKDTDPAYLLDIGANSNTNGLGLNGRLALSNHTGDGWLRLNQSGQFSNGLYTPNNFRIDGRLYFFTNNYLDNVTGDYGSIQINGGGESGWEGLSIDGRVVFMHDGSNAAGMYDDVNNQWMTYSVLNGESRMYHAGTWRIRTTSTGAQINSQLLLSSDRRRKENIKTLDNSLDKISQIRGVSFDWKDKEQRGEQTQYGVVAQEVQEVFPDLVVKEDNSDYLTVNYQGLIGPLIEAVKELKAENEDLKKRLEALEK